MLVPYLVQSERPVGAVIVLPGGGYARRADHEGEPVARWLNRLGLSAFVLNYRVAPHRYPDPLVDVQRAIKTVRHHAREWGIDPSKIGVLGFSAGGHLAALSGTFFNKEEHSSDDPLEKESSRPDFMVLCYPVITFQKPYAHEGSVKNLLGDNPSEDLLKNMSIQEQVSSETPPTFIWHTADDASVPVENALLLAGVLSRHNIPFELHVFEKGRHGLGLAEEDVHVRSWQTQCALWLKKQGWCS